MSLVGGMETHCHVHGYRDERYLLNKIPTPSIGPGSVTEFRTYNCLEHFLVVRCNGNVIRSQRVLVRVNEPHIVTPRYLTKSRFTLAIECPTKLYYIGKDTEYHNLNKDDSFLEMLADGGFQVGALAKLLYPGGHEIVSKSHAAAERQTQELLTQDEVILFEPAIRYGDLFIRIDILIKEKDAVQLIEVKAKSYDSTAPEIEGKRGGITSGMLPYIQDIAFQTYVLRSVYPKSHISSFLLMPDKSKRSAINGLNQFFKVERRNRRTEVHIDPQAPGLACHADVLTLVNVDRYVARVMKEGIAYPGGHGSLPESASRWAQAYKADKQITPSLGSQCAHCEFRTESENGFKSGFTECWTHTNKWTEEELTEGTVLDLWNFRGKDKLIAKGVLKLGQVRREDLKYKEDNQGLSNSQRQWMQVSGVPHEHDKVGYFLDAKFMKAEMRKWTYPYHFIDFETSAVALPFYKGMRPYEQVAFQFSHHRLESNGDVRHANEFLLATPGVFPNYEFARKLTDALQGNDGTVFMWSHHENTILERIITQLNEDIEPPVDKEELIGFIRLLTKNGERAMVDLKILAQKAYFHPDTKGSNSIKKVLPAVLNTSTHLREKYGRPIYGTPRGIPSFNYTEQTWWVSNGVGGAVDPYNLLKKYAQDLLGDEAGEVITAEEFGIAEGGAAASAYARLQFERLDDRSRQLTEKALLRYCELDSLAMVMIVEAWKASIES